MDDDENLAFKERSLDELIDQLASHVQGDGQYHHMRFPPTGSTPTQHLGPEYSNENIDPAFISRRNAYFQENFPAHQQRPLPFILNPPVEEVVPNVVDMHGGDYLVYGTPAAQQKSQNVSNLHYINKTNGTLTGFSDYGLEYSGTDYNLFSGLSPHRHPCVPQFPQTAEGNAKAQLIENLVGNWASDQSGTYSPFGSSLGGLRSDIIDNMGIGRGSRKTRIVAEVRPMRPSYSDVLSRSIINNQKQGQKNSQDMKIKMNDVKSKSSKFSVGRTLSGNGNILNRQLPPGVDESNFINNSNLKGSKKIDCENDGQEGLSKKWLSLDDLKNAAKRDSYININEVKNKKNSSKNLNNKTNANSGRKEKWESTQLNNVKNLSAKLQTPNKKTEKGNIKIQTGFREKENVSHGKYESGRSKPTEERRVPSVSQTKSDQQKSSRRSARTCQQEKHRKTVKNKRREQEPCISLIIKNRMDQYGGVLLFALNWLLRLVLDVLNLSTHLAIYMCAAIWKSSVLNAAQLYKKLCHSIKNIELVQRILNSRFCPFRKSDSKKKKSFDFDDESDDSGDAKVKKKVPRGLKHNISLPVTGEEAMKRLLACKGKDPYSILGVTQDCTDDDIKKYYKRQAFLVHPDKNNQPGAEEAFKILVHAFDIIGEPEHRKSYDRRVEKTQVEQAAWTELSDLLSQLHKKMEYVANTIRCTNCNKRHKRTTVDRPIYAARMCNQCKIHHAVREGDIWAETSLFGLLWHYYACMDGAVYDITEWAGCQGNNLRNLKANTHNVQYRIVLGKHGQKQKCQHPAPASEPDFEDFINNFYTKSDSGAGGSDADKMSSAARKRKAKKKK